MSTPIAEKDWYYNHVNAFAENTLLKLQTPAVRDLSWSCFSEPLLLSAQLDDAGVIENCNFVLSESRCEWLQALDADPRPLHTHLSSRKTQRLGLYFESLWHFFLGEDVDVDLMAHNLPVREGALTLGEFDCIYFCHRRQQYVHLELALKFYLSKPGAQESRWHDWLGPASKDRLDLKINRMLNHQVRLADTPAGAESLLSLGIGEPLRELEIKGRLFRHHHGSTPQPPAYNTALPLQEWCYASDLEHWLEERELKYFSLDRQQWLAPVSHSQDHLAGAAALESSGKTALATQFKEQLALNKRPLQIAGLDGRGIERCRLFLVDDDWPGNNA